MTEEQIKNQEVDIQPESETTQPTPQEEPTPTDNMAEESNTEAESTDSVADATSEDWRDKYLRLQAEFDNYRKRTLREKMELVQSGGSETIKAFLPIADDMDRARTAMAGSQDIEALRQGVELIAAKLNELFKQRGVVEIEALGLELDTDHHEAIARFAAAPEQKGKIIDVVEKGYIMGEKVLRFAKVVVGE